MKNILWLILICVCTVSVYGQKKKSAISIGPATLNFNLEPGQTGTQTVYIYNKLDKPYSFTIDLSDWGLDTSGNDVYYSVGTIPRSCAQWVKIDKKTVEVMGNSREAINVTMTVPDSATSDNGTRWTMMNIATNVEKKAPKGAGGIEVTVNKNLAVGVRIYQTPKMTTATKEIKMLAFNPLDDSTTYRIESRNTGEVMLRCHYSIELSSQETGDKTIVGPVESLVLPGEERYVDLKIPASLKKGKYTAVALIEPGDDNVPLEAAEREIDIK